MKNNEDITRMLNMVKTSRNHLDKLLTVGVAMSSINTAAILIIAITAGLRRKL